MLVSPLTGLSNRVVGVVSPAVVQREGFNGELVIQELRLLIWCEWIGVLAVIIQLIASHLLFMDICNRKRQQDGHGTFPWAEEEQGEIEV